MGSKPSSQQNTSSTFTPPPQVLANYTAVTNQAQNVAATPYSAYGGQLVSPINGQQNTGIGAVNSASGIQDPYNAVSGGLAGAAAGQINPETVNASSISQYESPYQSDVVNATEAEIQNQNQQQSAALQGNAIASGAFGGDRAGVAQAALAGQQDIAENATLANLNNQNYSQALGEANTQQTAGMTAQQETAANRLAASQQLGNLGNTAQTEALNEANAQTNAGTLEQTTQQAQDTAAYNQFLQQQAYPFETTGWLANIVEGIGSQSGGTTTGTSQTDTSTGSQLVGLGLGLGSFLARGGRIPVPKRASGGLIIPNQDDSVFNPTASGGPQGLGGGSVVPQINLAVGHTAPGAAQTPSGGASPQQQGQSIAQTAKAVQSLGSGLGDAYNSLTSGSLGDNVSALGGGLAGTDFGGLFNRGGVPRRHYDSGGDVTGDANQASTFVYTDPLSDFLNAGQSLGDTLLGRQSPAAPVSPVEPPLASNEDSAIYTPSAGVAPAQVPTTPADAVVQRVPDTAAPVPDSATVPGTPQGLAAIPMPPTRPPIGPDFAPTASDEILQAGSPSPAPGVPEMGIPAIGGVAGRPTNLPSSSPYLGGITGGAAASANPIDALKNNISNRIESGGSYTAVGPTTAGGDNGYGKYQVMGTNVPVWTKQILGTAMTPQEFLANPQAQEQVASAKLGEYYSKTGSLPDTASMWFTGRPLNAGGASAHDVNGMTGATYAATATKDLPGQVSPADLPAPGAVPVQQSMPQSQGFLSGLGQKLGHVFDGTPEGQQVSTPQYPQNSPTPSTGRTGLLGLNISPETRQLMLSAGLGIMGGTSRSALTNIGQGGLQGIQSAANTNKTFADTGLIGAQTQSAQSEAQLKNAQVQNLLLGLKMQQDAYKQMQSDQPSLTDKTITAPTVAPSVGTPLAQSGPQSQESGAGSQTLPTPQAVSATAAQTAAAEGWRIDPNSDPANLERQISYQQYAPAGTPLAEAAQRNSQRLMQILQSGQVLDTGGAIHALPGYAESKAVIAGPEEEAKSAATVGPEVAKVGAVENFKTQNAAKTAALSEAQTGQLTIQQAQAMKDLMFDPKTGQPRVNTGPLGPTIQHLASLAEQAGVSSATVQSLLHTDPNKAQSLEKLRTSLGSESARQDLPGSQIRVLEFNRYLASVPNNQILPGAFKYMIDNAIIPRAQQQVNQYKTIQNLNPAKDDIQGALFNYRQSNPWYTPQVATPQAQPQTPTSAPPNITADAARAELARRAALKQGSP